MFEVNNPELTSWVRVPADSDFPIQNLPFGIFSTADRSARPGVAIGEHILDLADVAAMGLLDDLGCDREDFEAPTLNAFIGRGKQATRAVRNRLGELLQSGATELSGSRRSCVGGPIRSDHALAGSSGRLHRFLFE